DALDGRGDLAVDGLGRGAGEARADGEGGALDNGELAYLDAEEGGETGDDDQRVDDDRQHRPAHEQSRNRPAAFVLCGDAHDWPSGRCPPGPLMPSSSSSRTEAPAVSCCTPWVTTWSPGAMSPLTRTPSELRWMICTRTRSTLPSAYFQT